MLFYVLDCLFTCSPLALGNGTGLVFNFRWVPGHQWDLTHGNLFTELNHDKYFPFIGNAYDLSPHPFRLKIVNYNYEVLK